MRGDIKYVQEMREFLEQQTTRIEEYDEQLVIRLIEKIIAYRLSI